MILQFIRRDPAWKLTPWFTGATAMAAVLYSWYGSAVLGAMGGLVMVLIMRAAPHQRVTFFEAALPVSGRDLFLARLLSMMALIWLPTAATAAMLLVTGSKSATVGAVTMVAPILTLGLIVPLSVRIKQFSAPNWVAVAGSACIMGVLAMALLLWNPFVVAAFCATAALVLGTTAWKRVPEAFQSAPFDISVQRTKAGGAHPALPWWPIIRSLLPWQAAIFIPLSFWWAFSGDWIYAPMYLMMAYSQTRLTTRWAQALPLSRRTMVAVSMLPVLMVLACGAELGMLGGWAREGRDLVRQGDPDHFRPTGTLDVFVNRAFWQPAPGGSVPVIQSPWGETFQPERHRIFGLTFYNPYSAGVKNSRAFEEWQFSRATADIYGKPMTPRQFAESRHNLPTPVTLSPRMQLVSIGALLAIAMFWAWVVELSSWRRLGQLSSRVRHLLTFCFVVLPIAFLLGVDFIAKGPGFISQPALEGCLLFASRHLPENLLLVAAIALVPLAGLFWTVARQAAASEIPQNLQISQNAFGPRQWRMV